MLLKQNNGERKKGKERGKGKKIVMSKQDLYLILQSSCALVKNRGLSGPCTPKSLRGILNLAISYYNGLKGSYIIPFYLCMHR